MYITLSFMYTSNSILYDILRKNDYVLYIVLFASNSGHFTFKLYKKMLINNFNN